MTRARPEAELILDTVRELLKRRKAEVQALMGVLDLMNDADILQYDALQGSLVCIAYVEDLFRTAVKLAALKQNERKSQQSMIHIEERED